MKTKFKKAMTLLALVSLGVTGLASCGTTGDDKNGTVIITPSWSTTDTLFAETTYSLEASYSLDENAKFLFSSNAPSAFKMEAVADNKIDFSFSKKGNYTITASLESDVTINSTINVAIDEGEVSYRIEADTDLMSSIDFEQGSAFNSDGLLVYKTKYIGENATNSKITLNSNQYTLYITEDEKEIELVDGQILKIAGEFDIKIKAHEENVLDGTFTINVTSKPTYLSDQFFADMNDEYSIFILGKNEEGENIQLPWLYRTKDYIMSFDSFLMGTYGIGFYLDETNLVRQFYLDEARSTDTKVEFTAGKQLYVDGLDASNNIIRTTVDNLSYSKGFFKYTDGTDYKSATFGKEGKPIMADGQTIFSFSAAAETQTFLTGLIGITELLNYGFTISSQIAFIDDVELGLTSLLSVNINIPGGGSTGGTFLILNGRMEDKDLDSFIASKNKVVNETNDANLNKVIDIVRGNDFIASDESNFVDDFQGDKDLAFGIYYSTPSSYMTSSGYKQSESAPAQYLRSGVLKLDENETTYPSGLYAYTSQTANGSDAKIQLVNEEAIFNQYMPRNWPGFTNATDTTATIPNNDYTSQWILQTLPTPVYQRNTNGEVVLDENKQPIVVGYEYEYRLPGAATALLWSVVTTMTPAYAQLFTGDSLIINATTDLEGNLTEASIVFHGKVSSNVGSEYKMYSACNILKITIDVNSVGKTVNQHIQKFIENNKPEPTK